MRKIEVHITGADSDPIIPARDSSTPIREFDTFDEAGEETQRWVTKWLDEGYHQTPALIFVKGSLWRRVVVIDKLGVEWFPIVDGGWRHNSKFTIQKGG